MKNVVCDRVVGNIKLNKSKNNNKIQYVCCL